VFQIKTSRLSRRKPIAAAIAVLVVGVTGLVGVHSMASAGASQTYTTSNSNCTTNDSQQTNDPNNSSRSYLSRHCTLNYGVAAYTGSPADAGFPNPLLAIGYAPKGDVVLYCQVQSSQATYNGSSWFGLAVINQGNEINADAWQSVNGLGWIPADAIQQRNGNNTNQAIPGVPNCGDSQSQLTAQVPSTSINGGNNGNVNNGNWNNSNNSNWNNNNNVNNSNWNNNSVTSPSVNQVSTSTNSWTNNNNNSGNAAQAYNPNRPMRTNGASPTCSTSGNGSESFDGQRYNVSTCDVISGAQVYSFSTDKGSQHSVLRSLTAGSQKVVCQWNGIDNPTSTNRDGTVNHNTWWLLTAKSDGSQGWVPATYFVQGGENQPVLDSSFNCPGQ
jgi:hypothetical protein